MAVQPVPPARPGPAVRLCTREGDDGLTTLGFADRIPKTAPRVVACGDVEEANAAIGAAISTDSMPYEFDVLMRDVQSDLLDVHADLSVAVVGTEREEGEGGERDATRIGRAHVERLEAACDRHATKSPVPGAAVFGGSNGASGLLRLARTVTRRAERSVWALIASEPEGASRLPAVYLNRLADLLLAVALRVEEEDTGNLAMGACNDQAAGAAARPTGQDPLVGNIE